MTGRSSSISLYSLIGQQIQLWNPLECYTTMSVHRKHGCPICPVSGPTLNLYRRTRGVRRRARKCHEYKKIFTVVVGPALSTTMIPTAKQFSEYFFARPLFNIPTHNHKPQLGLQHDVITIEVWKIEFRTHGFDPQSSCKQEDSQRYRCQDDSSRRNKIEKSVPRTYNTIFFKPVGLTLHVLRRQLSSFPCPVSLLLGDTFIINQL